MGKEGKMTQALAIWAKDKGGENLTDNNGKQCWRAKVSKGRVLKEGDTIFIYQNSYRTDTNNQPDLVGMVIPDEPAPIQSQANKPDATTDSDPLSF